MSDGSYLRPFVSVIIPVYNEPDAIRRCLEALESQTYPDDRFEVLVVDNNSTDRTAAVIQEFDVTYLREAEIQGSYAARNTGLRQAKGEIIAFTDADCTPAEGWLAAGVEAIENGADLVGGNVEFTFSEQPTAAERFDASVNMRNKKAAARGVAKTANVFATRAVVNEIGPFPDHLISGGDVHWTGRATDAGFDLVYSPTTRVSHPTRQLQPLLKKQYRVGKGQIEIWQLDEQPVVWTLIGGLLRFPLKVGGFLRSSAGEESSTEPAETEPENRTLSVYLVAALCILAMNLGRVIGAIRSSR